MGTTASEALIRHKSLRGRAASLVAAATDLRPRLSQAEDHYFYDLRALDARGVHASFRIRSEMSRVHAVCIKLAKISPLLVEDELQIAKQLLTSQNHIFCGAGTTLVNLESKHR